MFVCSVACVCVCVYVLAALVFLGLHNCGGSSNDYCVYVRVCSVGACVCSVGACVCMCMCVIQVCMHILMFACVYTLHFDVVG